MITLVIYMPHMPPRPPGDEHKLRELILYVSQKLANDPTFGATKLNNVLFFSDFLFYGYKQRPITGVEYQKLPKGPAPRRLVPVRDKMIENKELGIQPIPLQSGFVQMRTVNLRAPDLSLFTGEEIAMVDKVIEDLRDIDAETTSHLSHLVGWLVVNERETISLNTIYFSNPPLTDDERLRARELKALKQRCGETRPEARPVARRICAA